MASRMIVDDFFCQLIYKKEIPCARDLKHLRKHPLDHDSLVKISHSFFSSSALIVRPCVCRLRLSHSTPVSGRKPTAGVVQRGEKTLHKRTESIHTTKTRQDLDEVRKRKRERAEKNTHKQVNWNCVLCDLLNTFNSVVIRYSARAKRFFLSCAIIGDLFISIRLR